VSFSTYTRGYRPFKRLAAISSYLQAAYSPLIK
jgi:hypothetical protein